MDIQLINAAAKAIREKIGSIPRVAMVLGSGWNILIDSVADQVRIPYAEIPGMKKSTVPGHAGEWVYGKLNGQPVLIMSGRLHYYEGHDMQSITYPIQVLKALGVKTLVLTNAAGAVNEEYHVCDLMLITDHINLTGQSPLIGKNDDAYGPRFPDMSEAYSKRLRFIAREAASESAVTLREGVYAWMTGPSFETPAEIRMLRTVGADAVGMSTVPEVIAARHAGMEVMALSCLTNMAAGVLNQPLSHAEVIEAMERAKHGIRSFMEILSAKIF